MVKEVEIATVSKTGSGFTAEEEKIIAKAIAGYNEKVRLDMIDTEIRNRILDEQRKKPGYRYY